MRTGARARAARSRCSMSLDADVRPRQRRARRLGPGPRERLSVHARRLRDLDGLLLRRGTAARAAVRGRREGRRSRGAAGTRSRSRRWTAAASCARKRWICSSRPTAPKRATWRSARWRPPACTSAAASRRRSCRRSRAGTFLDAFRAKEPLADFVATIPVAVILNPEAGLARRRGARQRRRVARYDLRAISTARPPRPYNPDSALRRWNVPIGVPWGACALVFFCSAFLVRPVFAQQTGSISGKVTDTQRRRAPWRHRGSSLHGASRPARHGDRLATARISSRRCRRATTRSRSRSSGMQTVTRQGAGAARRNHDRRRHAAARAASPRAVTVTAESPMIDKTSAAITSGISNDADQEPAGRPAISRSDQADPRRAVHAGPGRAARARAAAARTTSTTSTAST